MPPVLQAAASSGVKRMSHFPLGLARALAVLAATAMAAPPAGARPPSDPPSASAGAGDGSDALGRVPLAVPAFVDGDAADEGTPPLPTPGTAVTEPGPPGGPSTPDDARPGLTAPATAPSPPSDDHPAPGGEAAPAAPGGESTKPGQETAAPAGPDKPLPEIHYGDADLPEPVRKTRQAILDAAKSGDIEALRPVLEMSEMPPTLSKNDLGSDPITFLKETSGDLQGREILAILIDLLETGWVRTGAGTPQEMYVWPYFAEVPVDRLTPPQLVEIYRILTATDVDEMRAYDSYLFFKIGIGPDGTWHYFFVDEQ
jgi:hypothetical protein